MTAKIPYALLSLCGLLAAFAPSGRADTITLGSTSYDVIVSTPGESPDQYIATLEAQPWWGNESYAQSAADQVGTDLGFPNGDGPFFVFAPQQGGYYAYTDLGSPYGVELGGIANWYSGFSFAIARPVPDAGSTAALLGVGMLVIAGFRRKRARA
ncbi:MAG TPA: VPDSG-CTERM sorting domain-containing protein [Opitutaceae bacterium]|jgi:hypothetical protein|nr:VPDSG-CTERM sorting domain-containing protein [Opitutaceae bacterium]